MKIKYVHCSEPEVEKVYDTAVALKNNPFIHMPQEEFDKMELAHLENDADAGQILFYGKMAETPVITSGLIVHCDTKTEAKMLMHIAEEQGFIWGARNEPATANTFFYTHLEETCYRFEVTESGKYISYADKYSLRRKGYSITEFDKFFFGVSYEEMQEYGYEWEGMYGMTKERAMVISDVMEIYRLYDNNAEGVVECFSDLYDYDGMFGVEQDEFTRYVDRLYKSKDFENENER